MEPTGAPEYFTAAFLTVAFYVAKSVIVQQLGSPSEDDKIIKDVQDKWGKFLNGLPPRAS